MSDKKFKIQFGRISVLLIIFCLALVAIDITLKYVEEAQGWNFTVIPGFIWVESGRRNDGAAFSMLSGNTAFLITFAIILLVVLVVAFVLVPEKRFTFLKLALAMVIAGAIGNLFDRFECEGYVRDFVWINMFFSTACCNFADFFIVIGIIFAIADCLFFNEWALVPLTRRAKAAQKKQAEEEKKKSDKAGGL